MNRKAGKRGGTEDPLFGNSEWNQVVTGAEMLEVELTWDYHGKLQARVYNRETGETQILTAPPKNSFCV